MNMFSVQQLLSIQKWPQKQSQSIQLISKKFSGEHAPRHQLAVAWLQSCAPTVSIFPPPMLCLHAQVKQGAPKHKNGQLLKHILQGPKDNLPNYLIGIFSFLFCNSGDFQPLRLIFSCIAQECSTGLSTALKHRNEMCQCVPYLIKVACSNYYLYVDQWITCFPPPTIYTIVFFI